MPKCTLATMFKRIISIMLCMVAVIALSGCQKSPDDGRSKSKNFPIEMLPYIVTMRGGHITCEDFEWGDSLDTVMKSKGWTKKNINDEETNTQLDGDIPFKYPGGLAQVSYRFVDNKLFGSDYFLLQKDKEEQDSVLKELTEQAEQYWPKPIGQTLDENLKRVGARWFDEDKGYVDMLIGVTGDTNEHFIKLTIRAPTEYKKGSQMP